MANIVATFTPTLTWRVGGPNNKSILRVEGTLVVTSPGGTNAGEIPASLFGLARFIGPQVFTASDNAHAYDGYPEYTTAASVVIGAMTAATMGDLPNGTYKALVQGWSV